MIKNYNPDWKIDKKMEEFIKIRNKDRERGRGRSKSRKYY